MAELKYSDLNLKRNTEVDTFEFGGNQIEVLKYLPVDDKYDIVMITLQKSAEDGIFNPIKLDAYFHLNLVYVYTNIIFSEEDREDESKLYDELKSSGFMDKFLSVINPTEYAEMLQDIDELVERLTNFNTSFSGVVKSFINELPENAEEIAKIVDNFDPTKYQEVINFANAANGGRPIK